MTLHWVTEVKRWDISWLQSVQPSTKTLVDTTLSTNIQKVRFRIIHVRIQEGGFRISWWNWSHKINQKSDKLMDQTPQKNMRLYLTMALMVSSQSGLSLGWMWASSGTMSSSSRWRPGLKPLQPKERKRTNYTELMITLITNVGQWCNHSLWLFILIKYLIF